MNVEDIVKIYLIDHGYDILYCKDCHCKIDKLFEKCEDNICVDNMASFYEKGFSWCPPNKCVAGYLYNPQEIQNEI
jgi:hypothetical protein